MHVHESLQANYTFVRLEYSKRTRNVDWVPATDLKYRQQGLEHKQYEMEYKQVAMLTGVQYR